MLRSATKGDFFFHSKVEITALWFVYLLEMLDSKKKKSKNYRSVENLAIKKLRKGIRRKSIIISERKKR